MAREWRLAPRFLLRSAGFPLDFLRSLICERAAKATDDALNEEDATAALGRLLAERWSANWPKPEGLRLKTFRDRIQRGGLFNATELQAADTVSALGEALQAWNGAVSRRDEALRLMAETVSSDLMLARNALLGHVVNQRVREAIFLSSPSMYAHVLREGQVGSGVRNSRAKRDERQLVQYLQRLCAKNETTSFFGPINYGRVADENRYFDPTFSKLPVTLPERGAVPSMRRTFVAYWAVRAIVELVERITLVRAACPPRLDYTCALEPGSLYLSAFNRSVLLTREQEVLIARFDDHRSLEQCARDCGLSVEEAETVLGALSARGLVRVAIPLSATDPDPLVTLLDFLNSLGPDTELERIRVALKEIATLREHFSPASVEEKAELLARVGTIFTELTGGAQKRGGGAIYADRLLLYEECRGDLGEVELDAAFAASVTRDLEPWLDLWTQIAVEQRAAIEPLGFELWECVFGDNAEPISLARFLREVAGHPEYAKFERRAAEAAIEARDRVLAGILVDVRQAGETSIVEIDVRCLADGSGRAVRETEAPLLVSPDLMLVRGDGGKFTIVLGEAHDTVMVWGWALGFHPRSDEIAQEMWDFLAQHVDRNCSNVLSANRVKIVPFEYPGTSILMRAPSREGRNQLLPIAHVEVRRGDFRLSLHARGVDDELRLYNGELKTLIHALFSLPQVVPPTIETGIRTPRIVSGDLVIQRARWRLDRTAFGLSPAYGADLAKLALDARRARTRHGMPEQVFMRPPSEGKPVMIDFRSLHALEMLDALMPDKEETIFTEMLPDVDGLWLEGPGGALHTCELRCTFAAVQNRIHREAI